MIRPLYLDAALSWQVRLDDGPALNVCAPGRARSLYPLQRLARVVCSTQAQWTTTALLACLRAGVPVIFHDTHGETVGWCFGPRKRETTLGSLLRQALDAPQGAQWIELWYEASHRREILTALKAMGAGQHELDPAAARSHLCNLHRTRLGQPAGRWLHALRCANSAWVAERLHTLVGDPALIGFAGEGLHLGKLLADLMEWQLHAVLHDCPVLTVVRHNPGRFAANALEHHGTMLHSALGQLVGRLEHDLRERLT